MLKASAPAAVELSLSRERRGEPRFEVDEEVSLFVRIDDCELYVPGRVNDISAHGFRVTHQCDAFRSGQEVTVIFRGTRTRARVVWRRELGHDFENGLVVIEPARSEKRRG
jgi:hypothetical protein